jgi:aminoglycoside 3-N-acetyltransferase
MSDQEITQGSIAAGLRSLGLGRGDVIVLHSNLQSLGKARVLARLPNCGADCLIDAFLEVIGPDGILCVPVFTKTFASPNSGPAGQIFDPESTPSRVGSITNVVLNRPESVRSLHPTHSWSAIGNRAEEFVAGHEKSSTFGRDSICGRMYDWDAKIVWFGTTGTTNTSTHFPEDWLELPCNVTEDSFVKDGDGWKKVPVYRAPSGPRDFYRNGCKLDGLLEKWNIQTTGQIHEATVKVMRHRVFLNHILKAMIDDPCLLLADGKDDAYHQHFYRFNREHMDLLKRKHGGAEGILKALNCRQK